MRYLLDTHAFLWFVSDSDRLGARCREAMLDSENQLFWSAASEWELAIKSSLGKIELGVGWREAFRADRERNLIYELPISLAHCSPMEALPWHHRDPFDRLLISQAIAEDMVLLSRDENFAKYDVSVLW